MTAIESMRVYRREAVKAAARWRHVFLHVLLAMASFGTALAQEAFPSKPIHLIVPSPPGGTGDIVARLPVPGWSELRKQPIVVGFVAPAKPPAAIISALHDTLARILAPGEAARRLEELPCDIVAAVPARPALIAQEETGLYARVAKSSGAKAE